MMTKEEYFTFLNYERNMSPTIRKTFVQLIEKYFNLKEKYSKILDDCHDYRHETHCMKMTIRNLCEHFGVESEEELKNIYLNKPYTLEDLKEGMWVWCEIKNDEYCKNGYIGCAFISEICDNRIFLSTINGSSFYIFKENRFYPIQKANEGV